MTNKDKAGIVLTQNQRQNIRLVMEHLSIENTLQNYQKWDKILDWDAMAENIRHPNFDILCDIVYNHDKVGRVFVNVEAPDREAATAKIKNKKNTQWSSYEPVEPTPE
jgi:hypothetical protein